MVRNDIFECDICFRKLNVIDEKKGIYECYACWVKKVIETLTLHSNFSIISNSKGEIIIKYEKIFPDELNIPDITPITLDSINIKKKIVEDHVSLKKQFISRQFPKVESYEDDDEIKAFTTLDRKRRGLKEFLLFPYATLCVITFFFITVIIYLGVNYNELKKEGSAYLEKARENYALKARRGIQAVDFVIAENVARGFLLTKTSEEAKRYILPNNAVVSLLHKHWKPALNVDSLIFDGLEYVPDSDYAIFKFIHVPEDGVRKKLLIYKGKKNDYYVDWKIYEGIQDNLITEVPLLNKESILLVQAKLRHNGYYNFGYYENKWKSYKLFHPNYDRPSDKWLNVFAPLHMVHELKSQSRKGRNTLILKVKWTGKTTEILEIISNRPSLYNFKAISELVLTSGGFEALMNN